MTDEKKQQVSMHTDMFSRCDNAINNGCYFEAIMLEYAAIEGRLEVILGVLGLPCSKDLPAGERKDIQISSRIGCLNYLRKNSPDFERTKLGVDFFSSKGDLSRWIKCRNQFVHGLYKSASEYPRRIDDARIIAEEGDRLVHLLYNEAKRLRRLQEKHPERFISCCGMCHNKKCNSSTIKETSNVNIQM